MNAEDRSVYLDVCALNRPFDDQSQMRIRLETDAILLVLSLVRDGRIRLLTSRVHQVEIAANPDTTRRQHVLQLLQEFGVKIQTDSHSSVRQRAEELADLGMGVVDAAHVAYAEAARCDLVSVDDRLLRQCLRIPVSIWCGTPMAYCDKENLR